jgi:hypothetical protein
MPSSSRADCSSPNGPWAELLLDSSSHSSIAFISLPFMRKVPTVDWFNALWRVAWAGGKRESE